MADPTLDPFAGLAVPAPIEVVQRPSAPFDPIARADRASEVALVLRRPDGAIWLMTKAYYPPGVFRLPTGGIGLGEPLGAALARETREETGWRLLPAAYVAIIRYRFELPDA